MWLAFKTDIDSTDVVHWVFISNGSLNIECLTEWSIGRDTAEANDTMFIWLTDTVFEEVRFICKIKVIDTLLQYKIALFFEV